MSKRLLIPLIVLLAIALAAPPVLGIIYEKQTLKQFEAAPINPYVAQKITSYERGLYTSKGVLRLAFSDVYIAILAASIADPSDQDAYDAEVQAIIRDGEKFLRDGLQFNFTVQHGPVILRNGIGVALASVYGELESESGVLAEFRKQANLPYLLAADVRVGLGGHIEFETSIPPVSASAADTQIEFSGFNASGTYDTASNTLKAVGRSDSFEVMNEELRMLVSGIDVQGEGKQYTERMWLGDASFAIAELQMEAPLEEIPKVAMQKLQFDAGSVLNVAGDKLSVSANYQIGGVTGLPDTSLADMQMRVRMRDLDVAAVTEYLGIYEQLAIATPEAMQQLLPKMMQIAGQLMRGSPGFDLSPIRFSLNGEPFDAKLAINLDGTQLPSDMDPLLLLEDPVFMLGMLSAEGRIESAESIALLIAASVIKDQVAGSFPDGQVPPGMDIEAIANVESSAMIEGLIQQGMIRRANGKLLAELEFKQGKLLVNGVPIPL